MRTPSLAYLVRPLSAGELEELRMLAHGRGRVIERDGLSVFGIGVAARLELAGGTGDPAALSAALAELTAIPALDPGKDPGSPVPLALGALAFDRRAAGELIVPAVCVRAEDHSEPVAVLVAPPAELEVLVEAPLADLAALAGPPPQQGAPDPPDDFRLTSARPHRDFLERVEAALGEIRGGRLDKVVLAREVVVVANRPLRQSDLLARLRVLHPSCASFALDGFIGASPELLVRRYGNAVASRPLAGTAPRTGDAEADARAAAALLASPKERAEHRAVVETVAAALAPVVERLEVPSEPEIFELRNVCHLGSLLSGSLARKEGAHPSALELVGLLHPTPAVAGTPVEVALDYLAKLEDLDRDRYAGPVGWMDALGDGEWYVGIRSAVVKGDSARLFAGVGIVADSDPATELAETQLKLQAFLAAAVRP